MHEIELKISNEKEQFGKYRSVDIFIDGERFINNLERIERPYADKEGTPEIAGQYQSLSVDLTFLPSRHFLGEPRQILAHGEKTAILICCCGCEGCWDFVCRISVSENTVTWSDFEQVHREWDYSVLGTMTFDRENYFKQFNISK